MKNEPVVVEEVIHADKSKVWQALTINDQLKQWYFKLEDFQARLGFEFSFAGGDGNKQWTHLCRITEVIDESRLSYTWKYEGQEIETHVTFDLVDLGNGFTKITVIHEGLEKISTYGPEFARENFVAGWKAIIGTNLKSFLEG